MIAPELIYIASTGRPHGHNQERNKKMKKKLFVAVLATVCLVLLSLPALAQRVGFGELYYEGEIVRTVVPPASMPKPGRDNLYVFANGVAGQLPVAAVAPGDRDYHGGKWAFYQVTWDETAYLLASETDVFDAAAAGDLTITRLPENDFKCPIQP